MQCRLIWFVDHLSLERLGVDSLSTQRMQTNHRLQIQIQDKRQLANRMQDKARPTKTKTKTQDQFPPEPSLRIHSQDRNLDQNQTKTKPKSKKNSICHPAKLPGLERWLVELVRHLVDLEYISTKLIERPLIQAMLEDVRVSYDRQDENCGLLTLKHPCSLAHSRRCLLFRWPPFDDSAGSSPSAPGLE
jgi:hypothetical protein